jgi:hypothetical protein
VAALQVRFNPARVIRRAVRAPDATTAEEAHLATMPIPSPALAISNIASVSSTRDQRRGSTPAGRSTRRKTSSSSCGRSYVKRFSEARSPASRCEHRARGWSGRIDGDQLVPEERLDLDAPVAHGADDDREIEVAGEESRHRPAGGLEDDAARRRPGWLA